MKLYDKLETAVALLSSVLEELRPGETEEEEEEPQVLLRRSQRNRRSENNEVMGLAANNGAPAVPESWVQRRGNRSASTQKVRQWVVQALAEYEPMTKKDFYATTREVHPEMMKGNALKSFHQTMSRLMVGKHIVLVRGKMVKG